MKKEEFEKLDAKKTNVIVKMSPSYMLEEENNFGRQQDFMPETTVQVTKKKHDSKTNEVTYTYRFAVNGKFFTNSVIFIEPNLESLVNGEDPSIKFVKQTSQSFDLKKVSRRKDVQQTLEFYYDSNTMNLKAFEKKWKSKKLDVDQIE